MALYWHQNFMKSEGGQIVSWSKYIEAICYRFGGQKDPLEEFKDPRQMEDLKVYTRDFDILWNMIEISEKQALIFFLEGLEVEIKKPG